MDKDLDFRKLLELYSLCVESSNGAEVQIIESLPQEEQVWLLEALRSDYTNPVTKINENINFLRENIINHTTQEKLINCIVALKELQDFTENLDFAHDFITLGGLKMIESLLIDQDVRLRIESSELLGNINQNNIFCQSESINQNIIEKLVEQISQENNEYLLKKLIYALSCTVRGNQYGFERFIQTNGFELILNLIQTSSSTAIRCKIAFFIYCLFSEMDTTHIGYNRVELCMDHLNNCLINLNSFSELETEHLLGSLHCLIKKYPSINLKRKSELINVLKTQKTLFDETSTIEEIVFYTTEILAMLYSRCLTISI